MTDQRNEGNYGSWSFADTARHIGNLWRNMPSERKEHYHAQSTAAKAAYTNRMAEYKKSREYEQHQQYLADWKVKHGRKQQRQQKRECVSISHLRRHDEICQQDDAHACTHICL